jgi:hypothetical protein
VSDVKYPTPESLQQQLTAIDIDVRCSLALSRALLKGIAATSAQARHALDVALDEELTTMGIEPTATTAAVQGIVNEARAQLYLVSNFQQRLAFDLEGAIVEKAAALGDVEDSGELPGLRSCA